MNDWDKFKAVKDEPQENADSLTGWIISLVVFPIVISVISYFHVTNETFYYLTTSFRYMKKWHQPSRTEVIHEIIFGASFGVIIVIWAFIRDRRKKKRKA